MTNPLPLPIDDIVSGLDEILQHCKNNVEIGTVGERVVQRIEDKAAGMRNMIVALRDGGGPTPETTAGGDNQPRYTTKRLRYEIDEAKAYARREALEDAAQLVEANVTNMTLDRFVFDGKVAKNTAGHDLFMSSENVTSLLLQRAKEIRALFITAMEAQP